MRRCAPKRLRRLGDLNLESSESERIERELVTNEGLRATEAIHLVFGAAQGLSQVRAQRCVLYQLARAYELNAQPDKALASLDQLVVKSYPNSHYIDEAQFRRGELLFADKAYAAAQAAYEAVIKIGPVRVLQSESVQARLVAVQAGRERAQPGFLRRGARLGAGVEARPGGDDRTRHLEPRRIANWWRTPSGSWPSPSRIWTARRPSTSS
jgi:predicted Zn-dependent protease